MRPLQGVVFDLDDTLYAERDYAASGFRYVAEVVAGETNLEAGELFARLWGDFEAGRRGDLFNRLLAIYSQAAESFDIPRLVSLYRRHSPDIQMRQEITDFLRQLVDWGVPLALISDGYLEAQEAKVRKLGLASFFDPLILTDALGREYWKPHERAFRKVEEAWGLPGEVLAYVGDNPRKDFVAPRRLGWTCLRLRIPGQESFHHPTAEEGHPHEEWKSFGELAGYLTGRLKGNPGTAGDSP
ncbi:MAG: HAD family hydrolase [Deltaproteobacteria bacterium]|nr:HAD family hydrolase [Deltaproteobacteria bacterium]